MLAIGCSTDTFVTGDGGTGDGGGGDAIVADAPIDVASCQPTFCATGAQPPNAFCTDFDESNVLPSDWSPELTVGTVDLSASPAETCQSVHAHLAQVGGTTGAARIIHSKNVPGTLPVHVTLSLDVMLPKVDAGGTVFFFVIRGGGVSIGLAQRADGTWWLQSSLGTNTLASPLAQGGPIRGSFTHMFLDVTYSASSVSASLQYKRADNNNDDAVQANAAAISLQTSVSYIVGLAAATSTQNALDAYYDDVITTMQ